MLECEDAYRDYLQAQEPMANRPSLLTREFYTIVRKAKREYWKHIINSVSDDKLLYKVIC